MIIDPNAQRGIDASESGKKERCCKVFNTLISKATAFVIGLLLIGVAVICKRYHVNAIVTYGTGGFGGLLVVSKMFTSLGTCLRACGPKIKQYRENGVRGLHTLFPNEQEKQQKYLEYARDGNIEEITRIINTPNEKRPVSIHSLLHEACLEGQVEAVKLLMPLCVEGLPLHWAIMGRRHAEALKCVEEIIRAQPACLSQKDQRGASPLHLAVEGALSVYEDHHKTLVNLLLTQKADVNAQDVSKETPLHRVAYGMGGNPPSIEIMEMLINAGANVTTINSNGKTPVKIAQETFASWFNENQTRLKEIGFFIIDRKEG